MSTEVSRIIDEVLERFCVRLEALFKVTGENPIRDTMKEVKDELMKERRP